MAHVRTYVNSYEYMVCTYFSTADFKYDVDVQIVLGVAMETDDVLVTTVTM